MSWSKDNPINVVDDDSKTLIEVESNNINYSKSGDRSSSSIYVLLGEIESIVKCLQAENSNLRLELEKSARTISELNEINSYLGKQKDDRDSIKIEKALSLSIEFISSLCNEVFNNLESGHVVRDNVEVLVEDFGEDLGKTGIKLDYYKRGVVLNESVNTSNRPIQITVKKTGNKCDDNRVVSSTLGYHSAIYIEGFSKPAELTIYSYDKAKDPDVHKVNVIVNNQDSVVKYSLFSGDVFTFPEPSFCPPGMMFKGWSTIKEGQCIDSDNVVVQQDMEFYPIFEPQTYELRVHFQSSVISSVPCDIIRHLKDGEDFIFDFESHNGCDPEPKHIEGKMGPTPLEIVVSYIPGPSQLYFDDHFIVMSEGVEIQSGQPFIFDSVDLMFKVSSMSEYQYIAKMRKLRGSKHKLSLDELEGGHEDSDSFIINVSYNGKSTKSCEKNVISYMLGTSIIEPVMSEDVENSSLKLIDHNDSDGILHLNYSFNVRKYKITWTAAYKGYDDIFDTVNHGEMPTPPDFKPMIDYNNDTITFFNGWDKDIVVASSDRKYVARLGNPESLSNFIKTQCMEDGTIIRKKICKLLKIRSEKVKQILDKMVSEGLFKCEGGNYSLTDSME